MADLSGLARLEKAAHRLQQERDKAAGALEQLMSRLMSEFSCESVEAGTELLANLQGEERKAKAVYDKAVKAFEDRWSDELS